MVFGWRIACPGGDVDRFGIFPVSVIHEAAQSPKSGNPVVDIDHCYAAIQICDLAGIHIKPGEPLSPQLP